MAGKEKTYTIYRITSPRGKQYVGCTSMTVSERWRKHRNRADKGEAVGHPFYDEIRLYSAEDFRVEELEWTNERMEAMQLEEKYIALVPKDKSMNLSSGGLNDAKEGGLIFWERLNADPQMRENYLKRLSDTKKGNDWTDYTVLAERSAQWRKEHPREAYKIAYRALRIANKKNGFPPPCYRAEDTRPLKERLMHKYRLNEIRRQNAKKAWSEYSDEKREEICRKISEAQKASHQRKSTDEINALCANARAHIDRKKQGAAASQGIKKWWADLKADPVRYEEYMRRRTESLMRTLQNKEASK